MSPDGREEPAIASSHPFEGTAFGYIDMRREIDTALREAPRLAGHEPNIKAGGAGLDCPLGESDHRQNGGHLSRPAERDPVVRRTSGPRQEQQSGCADGQVDEKNQSPGARRQEAASTGPEAVATAPPTAETAAAHARVTGYA